MKKLIIILYAFSLFFKTIICSEPAETNSNLSRERYGLQHLVEHLAIASRSNSKKNIAFITNPKTCPDDLIDVGITYLLRVQRHAKKSRRAQASCEVVITFPKTNKVFALLRKKHS